LGATTRQFGMVAASIVSLYRLCSQSALGKKGATRQGALAECIATVGIGGLVQRLTGFIFKFIRLLLGTGLLLSVLLICANAFGRYVLHAPIIWAEEVLGYVLVWTVYLGAVEVTRDGGHLSMDLITQSLKPRWRRPLELVGNLVFLAVCALIIYQAIGTISEFNFYSQVAGLPMDVLHAVIPVSFGLMFLLVALRCVGIVFKADGEVPPA
jgi:TRAP-type C4-dicarboxylate transport system permease small subunit